MASRLMLQSKLEVLLGNKNVYYHPPTSVKINYPAIIYNRSEVSKVNADDNLYLARNEYTINVIDRRPDNDVITELLKLPYCTFDREYISDNLYHNVLTIFY